MPGGSDDSLVWLTSKSGLAESSARSSSTSIPGRAPRLPRLPPFLPRDSNMSSFPRLGERRNVGKGGSQGPRGGPRGRHAPGTRHLVRPDWKGGTIATSFAHGKRSFAGFPHRGAVVKNGSCRLRPEEMLWAGLLTGPPSRPQGLLFSVETFGPRRGRVRRPAHNPSKKRELPLAARGPPEPMLDWMDDDLDALRRAGLYRRRRRPQTGQGPRLVV